MMKTGHRICTAATPAPLLPEAITLKHIVQAPIKARVNRGSKKKCVTGLWDQNLPSDLLQEILSNLGIKDNIRASAVCKTWCEAAVSVRKLQPLPWLFYPQKGSEDGKYYILFDPSRFQTYKKKFPELKGHEFSCSRDGWLLVFPSDSSQLVFLFNPFTGKRIYLPERPRFSFGNTLAFSAAPTSSSCLVISFNEYDSGKNVLIASWRPGETVWRTHRFKNQLSSTDRWVRCVFSNDVFYFLSSCGYLSVFDPSRATWNILLVKPWTCPTFCQIDFGRRVSMMEHEGDVFVLNMRPNNILALFKLNLKRMVWEEKSEVGRLTIFASSLGSFARVGILAEEMNRVYPSTNWRHSVYHLLGDEESCCLPTDAYLSKWLAWIDPPHNNVNL